MRVFITGYATANSGSSIFTPVLRPHTTLSLSLLPLRSLVPSPAPSMLPLKRPYCLSQWKTAIPNPHKSYIS